MCDSGDADLSTERSASFWAKCVRYAMKPSGWVGAVLPEGLHWTMGAGTEVRSLDLVRKTRGDYIHIDGDTR